MFIGSNSILTVTTVTVTTITVSTVTVSVTGTPSIATVDKLCFASVEDYLSDSQGIIFFFVDLVIA